MILNNSKIKNREIQNREIENLEIRLMLEAVFEYYGYDFRDYAAASIRRRIWKRINTEQLKSVSGLQERILHDPACFGRLLRDLTINVTDFFRDPDFYRAFRQKVVPLLRTYPFVRIWHAGCASGEEVYSMAILLHEEGLYERCRLYATDIAEQVLEKAGTGIFPLKTMKRFTENHIKAGGKAPFSTYYTAKYNNAIFKPFLKKKILFAQHNLAVDSSFNEFNAVICRNVMIYFNHKLQARAHRLFYESLCYRGILGLGEKESLIATPHESDYELLDKENKLYRKVGG
jgi:chemotaxis protein methyltransferase CheR